MDPANIEVFTASFFYTMWSCSSSSHLLQPAVDIEMSETNVDLAKLHETRIGKKQTMFVIVIMKSKIHFY